MGSGVVGTVRRVETDRSSYLPLQLDYSKLRHILPASLSGLLENTEASGGGAAVPPASQPRLLTPEKTATHRKFFSGPETGRPVRSKVGLGGILWVPPLLPGDAAESRPFLGPPTYSPIG